MEHQLAKAERFAAATFGKSTNHDSAVKTP
jgi:hypothetical protein